VPFRAILQQLAESIDGAESALIVESDGEAVQWFTEGDAEQLRLRAAYVVIAALSCRESIEHLGARKQEPILIEYDGASFLVEDLDKSYFLILELNPEANIAQATKKFLPIVEQLRRDIA
jgi:predicted regulator of Ras-like GTPase activity (Roadblock/LC7/MglB family)